MDREASRNNLAGVACTDSLSPMRVEVTGLKADPLVEGVALSWGVSSTSYLTGFTVIVSRNGSPVGPHVILPAEARSYTLLLPPVPVSSSAYLINVRADVQVGGKTIPGRPLPAPPRVFIGVNGGSTWGKGPAEQFIKAGITSERIEIGRDSVAQSLECGFKNQIAVIGNTPDSVPLSQVPASWLVNAVAEAKECAAAGITLLEVGNEMYGKGRVGKSWPNGEGALYGRMLLALCEACEGVPVKLLANLFPTPDGSAWLEPMLKAAPALKHLLGGFSCHPYGHVGWAYGEGGMVAQHDLAVKLGVNNTDVYVTEYGVECEGTNKEPGFSAPDPQTQAALIGAMLASLTTYPWIPQVVIYGSHDENSAPAPAPGRWGLIDHQGVVRPALAVAGSFSH